MDLLLDKMVIFIILSVLLCKKVSMILVIQIGVPIVCSLCRRHSNQEESKAFLTSKNMAAAFSSLFAFIHNLSAKLISLCVVEQGFSKSVLILTSFGSNTRDNEILDYSIIDFRQCKQKCYWSIFCWSSVVFTSFRNGEMMTNFRVAGK